MGMTKIESSLSPVTRVRSVVAVSRAVPVVLVMAFFDGKLYQRTEPPPPAGLLGLPTWSVVTAIILVGVAALCLFSWVPARRLFIAVPFIVVVVAVTGFATKQSLANLGPDPCYRLNGVNVGNLGSFNLVGGSAAGAQWMSVLTDGISDPAPNERQAIVAAIDKSSAAATQLTRSLPLSLRPVVARLIAVAGSASVGETDRSGVTVTADIRKLQNYAFQVCGDAG